MFKHRRDSEESGRVVGRVRKRQTDRQDRDREKDKDDRPRVGRQIPVADVTTTSNVLTVRP